MSIYLLQEGKESEGQWKDIQQGLGPPPQQPGAPGSSQPVTAANQPPPEPTTAQHGQQGPPTTSVAPPTPGSASPMSQPSDTPTLPVGGDKAEGAGLASGMPMVAQALSQPPVTAEDKVLGKINLKSL